LSLIGGPPVLVSPGINAVVVKRIAVCVNDRSAVRGIPRSPLSESGARLDRD
jgi:hypothetical protein